MTKFLNFPANYFTNSIKEFSTLSIDNNIELTPLETINLIKYLQPEALERYLNTFYYEVMKPKPEHALQEKSVLN